MSPKHATRFTAVLAVGLFAPPPLAAQIDGWSVGFTWASMQTNYSGGSIIASYTNGDRRFISLGIDKHSRRYSPVVLKSGLRLTTKGNTVSGPTRFIEYVEIPLLASIYAPDQSGPFLEGGFLGGVRVYCRLGKTRRPLSCSDRGLSRWDFSWELGLGLRHRTDHGGVLVLGIRLAHSLIDIRPSDSGRTMNRVMTVGVTIEPAR